MNIDITFYDRHLTVDFDVTVTFGGSLESAASLSWHGEPAEPMEYEIDIIEVTEDGEPIAMKREQLDAIYKILDASAKVYEMVERQEIDR